MSLSVQLSLSLFIVGPSINLHLKGIALQPPRRCPFSYDYCFLSYHYYAPQTLSDSFQSNIVHLFFCRTFVSSRVHLIYEGW